MTAAPATPNEGWIGRNGWLLAAMWLVFLVPPLLTILTDESNSTGTKIVSTVLFVAFAAVYIDGFRRQNRREQEGNLEPDRRRGNWTAGGADGLAHFGMLVAITLVLFLVAGVAAIGTVTFVVAFAVFHFPWPAVWAIIAAGVAVTALVPVALGVVDELWFLSLITGAVAGAAVLIRMTESHQFDQAQLRTRLAISDERSRVARDVHDVLGHSLTAVILKVELCQRLLDGLDTEATAEGERIEACRGQLAELDSISRSALAEIRSTVGGLRATNLADEVTVARTVLADAGVDLLVTGEVADVPDGHQPMLAWVVREAVTNVVRHAKAEHCHIALAPTSLTLLRVSDDGVGLVSSGEGNGLRGLRERVAAAGGSLRIESVGVDTGELEPTGADSTGGTRIEVAV